MKMMNCIKGLMSLVLLLGLIHFEPVDGISCGDAVSALVPCGAFLISAGTEVPGAQCCASVKSLDKMASTVDERKSLCQCLKQTGPSFGVKPERAGKLPALCKIKLNIPISPDVDCSKVK